MSTNPNPTEPNTISDAAREAWEKAFHAYCNAYERFPSLTAHERGAEVINRIVAAKDREIAELRERVEQMEYFRDADAKADRVLLTERDQLRAQLAEAQASQRKAHDKCQVLERSRDELNETTRNLRRRAEAAEAQVRTLRERLVETDIALMLVAEELLGTKSGEPLGLNLSEAYRIRSLNAKALAATAPKEGKQ